MQDYIFKKSDEILINIFVFIIAFYPSFSIFNYIVPLVLLFCIHKNCRFNRINPLKVFVAFIVLFSCIFNLLIDADSIQMQSLSRSFVIVGIIFFFPFAKPYKLYNSLIWCSVLFLFLSQIVYFIGNSYLIGIFEKLYPYDGDIVSYTSDYLSQQTQILGSNSRFGGLFHNPNQCSRLYTILLSIFLIENPKFILKDYFLIFLIVFGVLITGSRTGLFIVIILLLINYYIKNEKSYNLANNFLLIFLFIIIFMAYSSVDAESFRALRLNDGVSGSFASKFDRIIAYLNSSQNFLFLFLGHFDQKSFTRLFQGEEVIDSELGWAIFSYGILFLISILIFYFKCFRMLQKRFKLAVIPMIWILTSTLMFSFKTSLLYFLVLSVYCQRSKFSLENESKYYC